MHSSLIGRTSSTDALPLSYGQERLLWLQQLDPESTAYLLKPGFRLATPADPFVVYRTLAQLVARHDVFRTTYVVDPDGVPRQVPVPDFVMPVEWISASPGDGWATQAAVAVDQPFDLSAAPPVRAVVVRRDGEGDTLFLVVHHIAADGRSLEILARDFAAMYQAEVSGVAPALPTLTCGYGDYALWQRGRLDERVMAEHLDYWREELAGVEPVDLPPDRPRPLEPSLAGDKVRFELPAETTSALKALALRTRSALSSALAAALQAVLSARSGQRDITIGTVLPGRGQPEIDDVVGFFVNTVAVRVDVSWSSTFRHLLRAVNDKMMAAQAHQEAPFNQVVAAVQPQREPDRNPLFDVMFVHQGEIASASSRVRWPESSVRFDLELETVLVDGRLEMWLAYRTDLFQRATVEGLGRQLVRFLTQVVADPDRPLSELDLVDDDQRCSLLDVGTGPNWAGDTTGRDVAALATSFAAQVARATDKEAVVWTDGQLTYGELDRRANGLARHLLREGVGPETVVALVMERSVDFLVCLLAVVKAGAVYAPLSPSESPGRLALMLDDLSPHLVIADHAASQTLKTGSGDRDRDDVTSVDDLVASAAATGDEGAPTVPVHPDQLAYVMYTSGSTGVPKGVAITQRSVVELASDQRWRNGAHTRVIWHSAHTFDASTYEIWVPLLSGGQVVVAPPGALDPATLARLVAEEGVTAVWLTAGLFQVIAEEQPESLAGLREVWTGGDVVSPDAVRRVMERCPELTLVNGYGPTEATTFATSYAIPRQFEGSGSVPIGRPMDDTRCLVLDQNLRLVPAGAVGELFISGAGLTRGYVNRPDLTAERLVANPFGPPGSRMYRTGDLARWRADGFLEFVGRADRQVKVRGFRIEPGEIEAVLSRHQLVGQAIVVVDDGRTGDRLLTAYVVPRTAARPSEDELRRFAGSFLPDYMVPAHVVMLDRLPLTANGKLDREALPSDHREVRQREEGQTGRSPGSTREELLCELMADLLGLTRVGVNDDFFELGGHSLLVVRLVSRIRSALDVDITIREVFERPTAAGLAATLRASSEERPPLRARPRPKELSLSPGQQQLWFLHRSDGFRTAYNVPVALRLSGALDHRALQQAVADVVERHESLRTVFPEEDGVPRQRVLDPGDVTVAVSVVDSDERRLAADLSAEASYQFDLATEVPLRVTLFVLSEREFVLSMVIHHIATDGWSSDPLVRDLGRAYAWRRQGTPPKWEPLAVHYADYTLWLADVLGVPDDADSLASRQLRFWREALAGLPDLDLPTDRPRPAKPSPRAGKVRISVPATVARSLEKLASAAEASLFMVAHASVAALLTRMGAGTDIPLGTPVAGRSDRVLEDLVGYFVNMVVLRSDTSGDPSLQELVERVRRDDLVAFANQELPFEWLVGALKPRRVMGRNPLFQVALTFQSAPVGDLSLGEVGAAMEDVTYEVAKFDLTFNFREHRSLGGEIDALGPRLSAPPRWH